MSGPDETGSPGGQIADDAAVWRRLRGTLGEEFRATPLYRTRLAGPTPEPFRIYPSDLYPPDPLRGEALAARRWRYGQERSILEPGEIPWEKAGKTRHFADRLHRFDWLSHLIAMGPEHAAWARRVTDHWIEDHGRFNGFSWRLEPTADRLWNWLRAGPELFDREGPELREARRAAFARQVRHLAASQETCSDPAARWRIGCVLVAAAFAMGEPDRRLSVQIERLEMEATAQILPDGGHVSRNPERLMHALGDLLTLQELYLRSARTPPQFFAHWIRRMAPMLAFFKAADGGLVPFNGGGESQPALVEAVLAQAGQPPRSFMFATKSGYQKLVAGAARVWMDVGAAPERPFADSAHAGCLSFELHDGPVRIVTSCGGSPDVGVRWQDAVRGTGAHSTLMLAGLDIGRWETNEETRLEFPTGPEQASARRLEEESKDVWVEAQHGGWRARFGLVHRRRLFLSADGDRLAGEDSLVRPLSQGPPEDPARIPFTLHFHLHPEIRAEVAGNNIRLIPPSGRIWRFKTSHPDTRLEISRYIARGRLQSSQQIVLAGAVEPIGDGTSPPNCIKWAFVQERLL
jgi:uncharacterized heparinase superfamily protein